MNSKNAVRKVSNVMKLMNKMLYSVFAFQLIIIAIFASASLFWMKSKIDVHTYVAFEGDLGF